MATLQESAIGDVAGRPGSHWPDIITAAQNPDFQPAEFLRLIIAEMSLACRELQLTAGHSSLEFKIKPLLAEIHALRALAETARSIPSIIAETDIVNLGGPKFTYVVGKFLDAVDASIREVSLAS